MLNSYVDYLVEHKHAHLKKNGRTDRQHHQPLTTDATTTSTEQHQRHIASSHGNVCRSRTVITKMFRELMCNNNYYTLILIYNMHMQSMCMHVCFVRQCVQRRFVNEYTESAPGAAIHNGE